MNPTHSAVQQEACVDTAGGKGQNLQELRPGYWKITVGRLHVLGQQQREVS
jgi:hypothetical protein